MNHQKKPHVVSDNPIVKAQKIESIIRVCHQLSQIIVEAR